MQQQLQPRPRLPGEEGEVSDEELVKRLRDPAFGTETSERLLMVAAADRIEALTEQLEAARADAKEAEAYADELAGDQVDLCRQLIAAEDKLAKAVEEMRAVTQHEASFFYGPDAEKNRRASWRGVMRKVKAMLAEIEGEKT